MAKVGSEENSMTNCDLLISEDPPGSYSISVQGTNPFRLKEYCFRTIIRACKRKDSGSAYSDCEVAVMNDVVEGLEYLGVLPLFYASSVTILNFEHFFDRNITISSIPQKLESELQEFRVLSNSHLLAEVLKFHYYRMVVETDEKATPFPTKKIKTWLADSTVTGETVVGIVPNYYRVFNNYLEMLRANFFSRTSKHSGLCMTIIQHARFTNFVENIIHLWYSDVKSMICVLPV